MESVKNFKIFQEYCPYTTIFSKDVLYCGFSSGITSIEKKVPSYGYFRNLFDPSPTRDMENGLKIRGKFQEQILRTIKQLNNKTNLFGPIGSK